MLPNMTCQEHFNVSCELCPYNTKPKYIKFPRSIINVFPLFLNNVRRTYISKLYKYCIYYMYHNFSSLYSHLLHLWHTYITFNAISWILATNVSEFSSMLHWQISGWKDKKNVWLNILSKGGFCVQVYGFIHIIRNIRLTFMLSTFVLSMSTHRCQETEEK